MTDSVKDSAVSAYQELTQNSENVACFFMNFYTAEQNKFGFNVAIIGIRSH